MTQTLDMINEKLCDTYQSAFLEPVLSGKLECLERGVQKRGLLSGLIVPPYPSFLGFYLGDLRL